MAGEVSMAIDAVCFDLDGTLFDHRGASTSAVDAFARHLGREPTPAFRASWADAEAVEFERWRAGQITFPQQRRRRLLTVLSAAGAPAPTADAELDALFAVYLAAYRAAWRAFPGVASLLAELRAAGYRIGVLTNGNEDQQLDKMRMIELIDLVDVVVTSERIGVHKPDPRAFAAVADALGVPASRCLFVGDSPEHDIRGAQDAGMRALLVDHGAADSDVRREVHAALSHTDARRAAMPEHRRRR